MTGMALVLAVAIWLSSGTMAPYAATVDYPTVLEPCHYIVSVDHLHFAAVFRMLAGLDRETWDQSVVLRRILYPIVAFPFVRVLGFLAGGLLASILVHLATVLTFVRFTDRRVGERGAIAVGWLLATYPGITYWAGLPYSYAAIVPACLISMILLYRVADAEDLTALVSPCLFLGIVFLAYDLLPFFAPAALLLLVLRKSSATKLVSAAVLLVIPSGLVAAMFVAMGVPLINSNTASYSTILTSYLHPHEGWGALILQLPQVFVSTFLFSNFVFLPLLFLVALAVSRGSAIRRLALPEVVVLVSVLAVFLFNNAAPPYYGWQLRGTWIARIYQPAFVAFLLPIARITQEAVGALRWRVATALTIALNASVAFGPITLNPMASVIYQRFYKHSRPDALTTNLRDYGRRPLGVCRPTHEFDDIVNPATPQNRPSYMFRYPVRDR